MNERIDSVGLAGLIDRLLDLSGDLRLSPAERAECLAAAKRLRGYLLNLLTARFNQGTPRLLEANAALTSVNADLKAAAQQLQKLAATLESVAKLVGILDDLLRLASSFL